MTGVFVQLSQDTGHPNCKPSGYVVAEGGCWEWVGGKNDKGYASVRIDGEHRYGHRVMYELHKGPIPKGTVIDHLCRNPGCGNPAHLEAVVQKENIRRGKKGVLCTHCKHGHEYTPENTYLTPGTGSKRCRTCTQLREKSRPPRHHRSK